MSVRKLYFSSLEDAPAVEPPIDAFWTDWAGLRRRRMKFDHRTDTPLLTLDASLTVPPLSTYSSFNAFMAMVQFISDPFDRSFVFDGSTPWGLINCAVAEVKALASWTVTPPGAGSVGLRPAFVVSVTDYTGTNVRVNLSNGTGPLLPSAAVGIDPPNIMHRLNVSSPLSVGTNVVTANKTESLYESDRLVIELGFWIHVASFATAVAVGDLLVQYEFGDPQTTPPDLPWAAFYDRGSAGAVEGVGWSGFEWPGFIAGGAGGAGNRFRKALSPTIYSRRIAPPIADRTGDDVLNEMIL